MMSHLSDLFIDQFDDMNKYNDRINPPLFPLTCSKSLPDLLKYNSSTQLKNIHWSKNFHVQVNSLYQLTFWESLTIWMIFCISGCQFFMNVESARQNNIRNLNVMMTWALLCGLIHIEPWSEMAKCLKLDSSPSSSQAERLSCDQCLGDTIVNR